MVHRDDPDFVRPAALRRPKMGSILLCLRREITSEGINRGIVKEVTKGVTPVIPQTKAMYIQQTMQLTKRGAYEIILGSTGLELSCARRIIQMVSS
ncbi:hypothetical protein F5B18DRAFT_608028 [Nemania serpens]|nr:hypothetical protein F5B18DRAFT_608028 [Nemania serpens]